MQTFLPYSDFNKSAMCLDSRRLNKQLIESCQILNTILTGGGWSKHPAVLMWKDNIISLYNYSCVILEECIKRGISTNFGESQLNRIKKVINFVDFNIPLWLGKEEFHSSHRSRLICKGEGDIICYGLKQSLKIRSIDEWLKNHSRKTKNQLNYSDIINLKNYYSSITNNIPLKQNHYNQFNWSDDPSNEYIWPSKL